MSNNMDAGQDAGVDGSTNDARSSDAGFSDAGSNDGSGDAGSDASPRVGKQRVFVTSVLYDGDLTSFGGSSTQAADDICQSHANAANISGSWRAWFSDQEANAFDGIQGEGPFVFMDANDGQEEQLFDRKAQLRVGPSLAISGLSNGPALPDENGDRSSATHLGVWSATRSRNYDSSSDCMGWVQAERSSQGRTSLFRSSNEWAQGVEVRCDESRAFLCIEQ